MTQAERMRAYAEQVSQMERKERVHAHKKFAERHLTKSAREQKRVSARRWFRSRRVCPATLWAMLFPIWDLQSATKAKTASSLFR